MAGCRCFWWEEEGCLLGEEGAQEMCPMHMERMNPETGEARGPVASPPERGDAQ
jgi:hypothetical protein